MPETIRERGQMNARMGVAYLWQATTHTSPLLQTFLAGKLNSLSGLAGIAEFNIPVPDLGVDLLQIGIQAGLDTGPKGSFWKSLSAWTTEFVNKIVEKVKSIFGNVFEFGVQAKKLSLFVAQVIYAQAAPFIGGTSTLISGLVKTGTAFVERFSSWLTSNSVKMHYGHPETIVNSIEAGLTRAMLDGIYDIGRSSLSLSLNAMSYGGSAFVDAIAGILDAAVKIVWRVYESQVIQQFCATAKQIWQTRANKQSAIRKVGKFDKWLRPAVEKVPVIAAVTLGSGIAGDKMRFLDMFADKGGIITPSQFEVGVSHLDKIKRSGARMIGQSEIEFTSTDDVVAGLLKLAASHSSESTTSVGWWAYLGLDKVFRS